MVVVCINEKEVLFSTHQDFQRAFPQIQERLALMSCGFLPSCRLIPDSERCIILARGRKVSKEVSQHYSGLFHAGRYDCLRYDHWH